MSETMSPGALKAFLDEMHDRYNRPDFIEADPVSIPHAFSQREDIEISAFLTALIAWGNRKSIINSAKRLMNLMDHAPYAFVMEADEQALARLGAFVHRTFNGVDARALVLGLRRLYALPGGLEAAFARGIAEGDADVLGGILHMRQQLTDGGDFPARSFKHIANPAAGASAKRINMFLRWMVRRDRCGVDFGLWQQIRPAQLLCPLDVHTGNVARKLALLSRKQNDWNSVIELTHRLRAFDPEDPVRYDFSLFGLGAMGGF